MISYKPLFDTMKRKNISEYRLNKEGISRGTIYTIKNNKGITTLTINKLCQILNCSVSDIIEYRDDEEEGEIK